MSKSRFNFSVNGAMGRTFTKCHLGISLLGIWDKTWELSLLRRLVSSSLIFDAWMHRDLIRLDCCTFLSLWGFKGRFRICFQSTGSKVQAMTAMMIFLIDFRFHFSTWKWKSHTFWLKDCTPKAANRKLKSCISFKIKAFKKRVHLSSCPASSLDSPQFLLGVLHRLFFYCILSIDGV